MSFNPKEMENFWEARFQKEGLVWGENPSRTASHALELFRKKGAKNILVPGSGYGRNTRLFSSAGLNVTGYEISETALKTAKKFDPSARVFKGSVLNMSQDNDSYDALYCFNVLHLFYENERKLFIKECARKLRDGGYLYFVVFSEKERGYGNGVEIEKNTLPTATLGSISETLAFSKRASRKTPRFTRAKVRIPISCAISLPESPFSPVSYLGHTM